MVTGRLVEESDREVITIDGGDIEAVDEFPYLGSLIASSGRMDVDVDKRVAQASKVFGALRKAVFLDRNLSLSTKRRLYNACVLSLNTAVWSRMLDPSQEALQEVEHLSSSMHQDHFGYLHRKKWISHITMAEVRRWGDEEMVAEKVRKRRLEWLGHVARMQDHRLPKSTLFGWLPQPRPRYGSRKRRRDVVRKDLKDIEVEENEWYEEARKSRAGWRSLYCAGLESCRKTQETQASVVVRDVVCEVCSMSFSREGDKKRHKCLNERQKPVSEQRGAVQCLRCVRWFKSKGGLTLHKCIPGS